MNVPPNSARMCAVRDINRITCVVGCSRLYFSETFFQKRESPCLSSSS